MNRSKATGKGKATSSGATNPSKRGRSKKPTWQGQKLSVHEVNWQPQLFNDKIRRVKDRVKLFIPERYLNCPDIEDFGVVEKIKALGWEAVLKCYDKERNTIHDKVIEEWVASLTMPPYDKPEDMMLVGKVGNKPVIMSFQTLDDIASFDNHPAGGYEYPPRSVLHSTTHTDPNRMLYLQALFERTHSLKACNLKIQVKLLFDILITNVMPRRGDTSAVRNYDLPILHALYTGPRRFSFRYLAMHNIWYCRNDAKNCTIPHTRLITALLKNHGVILEGSVGLKKVFKPIAVNQLGKKWTYTKTATHHQLKADKKIWMVPRSDVEVDIDDQEDVVEDDSDDEETTEAEGSGLRSGGWDYSTGFPAFDHNWAIGSMNEVIERHRPVSFSSWYEEARCSYDHGTFMGVSTYMRQEQWNRTHAYAAQQEVNDRHMDDRLQQAREDYLAGRPVEPNPQIVDYSTLPPYDGSTYYPVPPLHHSRWVEPNYDVYGGSGAGQSGAGQSGGDDGQGSGGDGAFNFGGFTDMMNSIFGPPRPPYQ